MDPQTKEMLIANYRGLFQKYGDAPEATQWTLDGQVFRFRKLMEIADLQNCRILDLGCGLGAFYPFLIERFGELDYTGIDIVPETIDYAARKYPRARFLCRDLFQDGLGETFDYVLSSGVFNNAMPDADAFMKELLTVGFKYCRHGMGFNFISAHVNFTDPEMAYHDPADVLDFCIRTLTRKVIIHHHYERVDVAVFAYR
jgi:SAM-dependent methyltransferase